MRGLAIVCIMLHNYCHVFSFAIKESEFDWAIDQTRRWGDYLHNIDGNFFVHVMSFFGFYFLPAFMFLGGYGLVRKYEVGGAPFKAGKFVVKSWRKLLALVLLPQLIFVALQLSMTGHTSCTPQGLLAQFAMASNFLIGCQSATNALMGTHLDLGIRIMPFVYWYLGMMMELYIIYALIHRFQGRKARLWVPIGIVVTGMVLLLSFPQGSAGAGIMRCNAPVGLIPFGLGLLAGRFGKAQWLTTRRAALLLPLSIIAIVAGSYNYWMWSINYLWGTVMVVCCGVLMRGITLRAFVKVGEVSALVYILHPVMRWPVIQISARYFPQWTYSQLAAYVLLTALAVILYRLLKLDRLSSRFIAGNKTK